MSGTDRAGATGAGGVTGGGAGTPSKDAGADPDGPVYAYGATVENTSADCPMPALPDGKTLSAKTGKLPNPFVKIDGTRLTKKSEWRCRRQEILEQAKRYVFGERPMPEVVSGTVSSNKIAVHVEALGKKIDFTATVVLHTKGRAPYPAVINVGAKGGFGGLTMGESAILSGGIAVI